MKKMMKRFKNERGLTLVELLAVIVILGIISTIAFVYIGGVIENSKKDAHIANAQQLISAAKLHEATGGDLSSGVSAADLQDGNYLPAVMVNPWGDSADAEYASTVLEAAVVEFDATDGYSVKFEGEKCDIDETEVDLATKDRDDICG